MADASEATGSENAPTAPPKPSSRVREARRTYHVFRYTPPPSISSGSTALKQRCFEALWESLVGKVGSRKGGNGCVWCMLGQHYYSKDLVVYMQMYKPALMPQGKRQGGDTPRH